MIALAFLIAAFVLFVIGAWPVPSRVHLISAGLACLVASQLVTRL
jgi:hypothetical protein